ncbi:hypothetical protein P5673_015767 [Acropora cervicornis]|uniref:Uncharacterized protein n=1 Tax=Acropora cervicornis TaxID=6130 RepID=A0AAD9QHC3_ACRCE|nr:hypothetical protein P5673_015767 [Acropora cervicornis]
MDPKLVTILEDLERTKYEINKNEIILTLTAVSDFAKSAFVVEASTAVVFIAKLVDLIMETPIELHYKNTLAGMMSTVLVIAYFSPNRTIFHEAMAVKDEKKN